MGTPKRKPCWFYLGLLSFVRVQPVCFYFGRKLFRSCIYIFIVYRLFSILFSSFILEKGWGTIFFNLEIYLICVSFTYKFIYKHYPIDTTKKPSPLYCVLLFICNKNAFRLREEDFFQYKLAKAHLSIFNRTTYESKNTVQEWFDSLCFVRKIAKDFSKF